MHTTIVVVLYDSYSSTVVCILLRARRVVLETRSAAVLSMHTTSVLTQVRGVYSIHTLTVSPLLYANLYYDSYA